MDQRPDLTPQLPSTELVRWYWTMAELQVFARDVGVSAAGPKVDLTERLRAHLNGEPAAPMRGSVRPKPTAMAGPLTIDSVIPPGQRSTEELRAFFVDNLGTRFTFDGHMRAFLRDSDGATLGDAIEHWHNTRNEELPAQSKSLEFNRFTKEWHVAHPNGTADECREAWQRFRSLAVDQRPPVADA